MKYLFLALIYFCAGFAFPNASFLVASLFGLVLFILTLAILVTLYDEHLERITFGD